MVSKESAGGPLNTPMMKQYLSVKERYRDEILFFRMGDFYEMFFDDAKDASEILGIALTSRSKDRNAIPMAGIPIRAVDSYVPKLLEAGKRVAICEQVQEPKDAQGIVDREVVRVVSPGTITDEKVIGEKANNFILSVVVGAVARKSKSNNASHFGLAWIDLSTGEFLVWEDKQLPAIVAEISRICPAECVLPENLLSGLDSVPHLAEALNGVFKTPVPDWCFDRDTAYRSLTEHFETQTLEGYGCDHLDFAVCAGGGLLHYLRETQKNSLRHITGVRLFPGSAHMVIDQATQRALEITDTFRGGRRSGTLLDCFDHTITALGARRLRQWLLKPLVRREDIVYRQDGVESLTNHQESLATLRELLRNVHDLERICARISYGSANGRDLVGLCGSLEALPPIAEALSPHESRFFRDRAPKFDGFEKLATAIRGALVDAPPISVTEGGLVREGYNSELDDLRQIAFEGTKWMARYQAEEVERVGIPTLKVGFNRVFGYFIEVTNTHSEKVPGHYVRKQTLKNAERYITPELKDFENRVLNAKDSSMDLEYRIFCELRDATSQRIQEIQAAALAISELDVVACLAHLAVQRNYVRPRITDDRALITEQSYHPVIKELLDQGDFVPNSIALDDQAPIMVITGPNMAGKSTYIRQVALTVLLAQTGSFVPATAAEIGVVDRIFTRVGAADDIGRGQSTFMVEMQETANILNNATERSLLILDEVGRGTSTFDGLSLAWAITEHICETLKARTLFATHYQELTELSLTTSLARNYTFQVKEWNEEIVFLRKIVEGATDKSYGIHVARLAGIPRRVITRARQVLSGLEAQSLDIHGKPSFARKDGVRRSEAEEGGNSSDGDIPVEPQSNLQLDLFQNTNEPLLKELKALDLDSLTPLQALVYLSDLRSRIV